MKLPSPLRALWSYLQPNPARELHYYVGLVFVSAGVGLAWRPGSVIVFGLGLMYLAVR